MKKRIGLAIAVVSAVAASVIIAIQPAQAAVGIRISNGRLVEANGQPLVLRGINHPHTWFKNQTAAFSHIKAAGANSVRVVLSGGRWQPADSVNDVANVIDLCKQNRLICVLENHDTTGFGEQGGAYSLDQAVDYWISVRDALVGQENYVILNIGNEPYGNNNASAWTQATINAVQRLRNAGFEHTIMVDAPNWGQDWQFVMRDNAPAVRNADPTGNIIFSIHMYGVFDTAAEITSYLDSFINRGLAIAIGEFGHLHSDGDPDEDTIMAAAEQRQIGYMGWSWSGNGCCVQYLDMVNNFDPNSRTEWGNRFITGPNGLSSTSREATIYSGQTSTTTTTTRPPTTTTSRPPTTTTTTTTTTSRPPTTTTTTSNPPTGGCQASYTKINEWPGGFQGEVQVTNTGSGSTTSWTVTVTFPNGQRITQIWNGETNLNGSSPYTVQNMYYNGAIPAGQSTTFGFLGSWNGVNNDPSLSCSRTP